MPHLGSELGRPFVLDLLELGFLLHDRPVVCFAIALLSPMKQEKEAMQKPKAKLMIREILHLPSNTRGAIGTFISYLFLN